MFSSFIGRRSRKLLGGSVMYNEMSVSFLAKVENVMLARTVSVAFIVDLNLQLNVINEIKTIVSEAVTNAIVHGYLSDSSKIVHMNLKYDHYNLYIDVVDDGIGIEDVNKAKEPLYSTKQDEERAGLGFTIMEVFTDKLEVVSTIGVGTRVSMVKSYNDNGEH